MIEVVSDFKLLKSTSSVFKRTFCYSYPSKCNAFAIFVFFLFQLCLFNEATVPGYETISGTITLGCVL